MVGTQEKTGLTQEQYYEYWVSEASDEIAKIAKQYKKKYTEILDSLAEQAETNKQIYEE